MVKYRFPGRPGKLAQRRWQSSNGHNEDFDGSRVANDTFCRLSIFNSLFSIKENEGSSFHGFSPHEVADTVNKKSPEGTPSPNKVASVRANPGFVSLEKVSFDEIVSYSFNKEKKPKKEEKPKKEAKKDDKTTSPVKFVLPTRSAHSSRVIKPNKRFIQNETSEETAKKPRLDGEPKCILRKPMLNIQSQSGTIEGPFSSKQEVLQTKIVCGVCGTTRPCKSYKQARKFGIFSCDLCRRFIIKIIKKEKEKTLVKLQCDLGTGNCSIRYSFTTESREKEKKKCQACWLNLCLCSFILPPQMTKRLQSYLPPVITQKQEFFDNLVTKWTDVDPLGEKSAREDSLKVKLFKEPDFKRKNKSKALPAGPRVKHVCRSASLVLGQKQALIKKDIEEQDIETTESMVENEAVIEIPEKIAPVVEVQRTEQRNEAFERPIARMLQDLGRDNCDLLDGMERHESEKRFAKVSIDFWESYDPDEVAQMGFPLLACTPLKTRALCFLCGSAGYEKLIHCASCCEPYHSFCVASLRYAKAESEWWKVDWICPRCCECEICFKNGAQLSCAKCFKNFHTNCVPSGRANISENWVCPSCLFCKSCNGPSVQVFVGNMPLCKTCFKLRKQGSFCPLCQRCYDDNDYSSKMMECAQCNSWIHAKCEGLSDEKYQVLSYLPSSIEFICRLCCKDPPPFWSLAVNADLKAGYLNVINSLSKNRLLCSLVKASPKKRVCDCQDRHKKPITLRNLYPQSPEKNAITLMDEKNSDLGLLTPKLTKDDEESLKTVKTGFLDLVNKDIDVNVLTIPYKSDIPVITEENYSPERCTCILDTSHLSLMGIKNKANNDEYKSIGEFSADMEKVIIEIGESDLIDLYHKSLKQVFSWYDPNTKEDTIGTPVKFSENKETKKKPKKWILNDKIKSLLVHEPDYYYLGIKTQDTRFCMLCKMIGEGKMEEQGRLLYCGQNEWVHVNCALWSSEVFEEIDGSLQNVHSAISRARLIRCSGCDKKGASVGCCAKSCPYAYHFVCALNDDCVFLENMEVYCKNHHNHGNKNKINDFKIFRSVYVELDRKKKKDVLFHEVKLYVGSLMISNIGEIHPEYSNFSDFILPCEYNCSRLYWSVKEPWKIVQYHIKTKLSKSDEYYENDMNYTLDHTLFTPPPSPVEIKSDDKDVKTVVSFLIDTVCNEENSDQQTDLLSPELEEAIFKDIPHDLFNKISMHDIFAMNFDDEIGETSMTKKEKPKKYISDIKSSYIKHLPKEKQENYLERGKDCWKNILQVDGAVDFESDQSNDSEEEEPVKCGKCRRTYRTNVGYERHLPTCSDYLSTSEESEEEKEEVHYEQKVVQNPIILQTMPEVPTYTIQQPYIIEQPYIQQPVIQTVPVMSTIITNGNQVVLNNNDVYNNVYVNPPMIVGMETVVSNTVMSSSQFISSSVPGMLSSYSATTTQVFQSKPVVPQSYVVVNNQPVVSVQNPPWNYQMNYQKNVYQTVRRQVIHEEKNDGVKMISTQETIVIEEPKEFIPRQEKTQIELPCSPAVHKEKPQQAVAPVVVKKVSEKPPEEKRPEPIEEPQKAVSITVNNKTENNKRKVHEEPKITYEITSEDGFTYSTTDIQSAWEKVFETVQKARQAKGLPLLNQNPFPTPNSLLKKMMGLGNNSVKYVLEQLPGISGCPNYKPIYHKRKLTALEQEMSKVSKENLSGCARSEIVKHSKCKYDMFSWLASRHRRPPKLLSVENDSLSAISRRAASLNLPMAMRFRHLKETSKIAVGVFRSDIHGRGLFCLRDIESGEMVIEYAGEVIRSALTDKRERHYTSKGIGCYMFRIDDKFVVDATMKGNAARFINHSCEPNCYSRVVDILGKKHILIFALRKILQGEELTYDYKFPLEEDKINCHCLSRRCRKYLN